MLMSALQDENEILTHLDLEEKKRGVDQLFVSNRELRDEVIANGKNPNEKDYATACQKFLQQRSDLKIKIEALVKLGEAGAILRRLDDAELRLADVRVNSEEEKSCNNGTSPQKSQKLTTDKKNKRIRNRTTPKRQAEILNHYQ